MTPDDAADDTTGTDDTAGLSDATVEAEEEEARSGHDADRAPTPEEDASAPTHVDPSVAEHFAEANRTGAHVQGEGQI